MEGLEGIGAGDFDVVDDTDGEPSANENVAPPALENTTDIVSAKYKCQSINATKLAVYGIYQKLKKCDTYDIGGTYTGSDQDLWFYYTTSLLPGPTFLFNLFIYHRKPGSVSIGISTSSEFTLKRKMIALLPSTLTWYYFKSGESNQNHFIKTFNFQGANIKYLNNHELYIPITIKLSTSQLLDKNILRKIKLNHDFKDLLAKQEKTDYILESSEKKQFPTHKIILAAHSPVLREIIRKSDTNSTSIDLNDKHLELLIEFLYTGTIKNIANQDCLKLLEIANKFQLKNLFNLTQSAIKEQINKDNAIDLAILSAQYYNEYADTTSIIPLVFVLSTGSDPFGAFLKFATEMNMRDRLGSISLGQGQGPVAEKMILMAKVKGDWIFLQNCHLAASWMLNLELIVANLGAEDLNPNFRLYLSSMPTPKFPVSVLQNSVKVTNEPPKGLKANVKRALIEMEPDFFENHVLEQDWRTMLFGICMFHAIIQERKKFGPLGWNITYEFNNSDRECAMLNLQMFCESGTIPWDALEYITSSITYGGRVTDMWDQRCLTTILKIFFSAPTLEEGYVYSRSGLYYCPRDKSLETYRNYLDELPVIEDPEVFGMHYNANIAFENKETSLLIDTIESVQPREASGGGGDSPDQIVWRICDQTRAAVPRFIDRTKINPDLLIPDDAGQLNSLTTVLFHETERFNTLLSLIHSSLNVLQRAIKGIEVMSEAYEEVFKSFINNRVPSMWHKKGYNSLKSLGSWTRDLILRVDFMEKWLMDGAQPSSWVSGLFFPQGLLTGTLQSYARRYRVPIDALLFDFWPIRHVLAQEDIYKQNKRKAKEAESGGGAGGYDVYGTLTVPEDGVNIHGLFLDAGRWDLDANQLVDPLPGQINPPLPVFWFQPVLELPKPDPRYEAPLYKTSERAGTLSTTGHSTNFVLPVLLPTDMPSSFWIIRGTALLTQITD